MTRIIGTIIAGLIPSLLWWLGGFNFDRRGEPAVFLALVSLWVVAFAWFCPLWKKT